VRAAAARAAPAPARVCSSVSDDPSPRQAVDLVINTFERTYRRVLAPGAFSSIREDNRFPIARCVALINNVADPDDAAQHARRLLDDGEIDEFHFVADRLDHALGVTALSRRQLEPMPHYSDAPLVAATLPGSPWLLYWDAEARLSEPHDWISPALELMQRDERVMVANPSWELPDASGRRPDLERGAIERADGFALGHGFSDQLFLARRSTLAADIYRQRCIVKLIYPTAHRATIFEARVAAYMRHHDRLRATSLAATYLIDTSAGVSSYVPRGTRETARWVRNALVLKALQMSPWRPRHVRHTWL
jgi:hypothetical protein